MLKRVLIVGGLDAMTETMCFRFREHGYLVHLLALASPQAVALWRRKMQECECEIAVEAFDVAMSTHQMKVDHPDWQHADLVLQLNGNPASEKLLVERCVNLAHLILVAQGAYDLPQLPPSSSTVRINTIRIVNPTPIHAAPVGTASSSSEALALRRGSAYEAAMLALYLASREAVGIADAVIDIPAGRYLS